MKLCNSIREATSLCMKDNSGTQFECVLSEETIMWTFIKLSQFELGILLSSTVLKTITSYTYICIIETSVFLAVPHVVYGICIGFQVPHSKFK
jgi:uncharacterized membrane protein AbrB (regulator of aidB expression)